MGERSEIIQVSMTVDKDGASITFKDILDMNETPDDERTVFQKWADSRGLPENSIERDLTEEAWNEALSLAARRIRDKKPNDDIKQEETVERMALIVDECGS